MKTYQVFLGTNKPTGGVVTTYEWSQFLKQIDATFTKGYTVLNARLGYSLKNSELNLKVNNLTDTLGFVHSSFLKESAPIAGRSFEIGYNLTF